MKKEKKLSEIFINLSLFVLFGIAFFYEKFPNLSVVFVILSIGMGFSIFGIYLKRLSQKTKPQKEKPVEEKEFWPKEVSEKVFFSYLSSLHNQPFKLSFPKEFLIQAGVGRRLRSQSYEEKILEEALKAFAFELERRRHHRGARFFLEKEGEKNYWEKILKHPTMEKSSQMLPRKAKGRLLH